MPVEARGLDGEFFFSCRATGLAGSIAVISSGMVVSLFCCGFGGSF
jgi:hypothetical protein